MSEENIGGEEGIIEERRKKLQLLRDKNKAYVNDFVKNTMPNPCIKTMTLFLKMS